MPLWNAQGSQEGLKAAHYGSAMVKWFCGTAQAVRQFICFVSLSVKITQTYNLLKIKVMLYRSCLWLITFNVQNTFLV